MLDEKECSDRCRSTKHGEIICAALTKRSVLDAELCAYLQHICCSCENVKDSLGRTALHVAASCGRLNVIKWLLKAKHANINAKDSESGYTPLHRSIFYGKLHVAIHLIKQGANVNMIDFNGLTCLEHSMKDYVEHKMNNFKNADCLFELCQSEVYVWGSNTNYVLGPQQARLVPELLDAFHKEYPNLHVHQICLEKFHCVIVTHDGKAFVCGHGQGGRLGLASEKTIMSPKHVKFVSNGHISTVLCKKASIALDHSMFLTDSGQVWTCGLNTYKVLGISPPPAQVLTPTSLPLMQHSIKGICAARYHSIAWGPKAIYAWGLNGGQLGHDKSSQKYIITPKLVTCFSYSAKEISAVATSIGATVVVTTNGDVYVFYEFQCRKITPRHSQITSVSLIGGKLDDKLDNTIASDGAHELKVVALSNVGNLYIWQENDPQFVRCTFSINRSLNVRQVSLNFNEILFVTRDGEAFQSTLKPRKRKLIENNREIKKSAFHEFLEKDNCYLLKVTKIPRIHRAVCICSDFKGKNYAVLQASPKTFITNVPQVPESKMRSNMLSLLYDFPEDDGHHDVIFKVAGRHFPAHRFVIASSNSKLGNLVTTSIDTIIELSNVNPEFFQQFLSYLYTGTCDVLKAGKCDQKILDLCENKGCKDLVRTMREIAKRFGSKALLDNLENVYYMDGNIIAKNSTKIDFDPKFERAAYPDLHDVVLKSKDGKSLNAHRCILGARLEYFNNLFSTRWNENSATKEVFLPIPYNVLDHLIEFLYLDDLPQLEDKDVDHICNLLIVSDQLFVARLKEICERTLSAFVTLKNVVQFLSFSYLYNAEQLKTYCMELICLNLASILESRCLEQLDDDLLQELSCFYCDYNPVMQQRIITPYSYAPSDEDVSAAGGLHHISLDESDLECENKASKIQKKRTRARKNTEKKCSELSDSIELDGSFQSSFNNTDDSETCEKLATNTSLNSAAQNRIKAIIVAQDKINCDNLQNDKYTRLPLTTERLEMSPSDFPELGGSLHSVGSYSRSPNKSDRTEVRHKFTKLSQKQRKRLSSETNAIECSSSPVLSESPRNPWKIPVDTSSPIGSPEIFATMNSIITDEKKQKENLVKMRTKLLLHTQMEDKAIEDLYKFYAVDSVFDEIISIERVQIGSVASPVWVHK